MVDYRNLGKSALKVSPLCLGTMMFGGQSDEATSLRIVDLAREGGMNFIDTADVYNKGRSEEVVGRAIAADRDRWVLATKLANPMGEGPNQRGVSRKWIFESVEASLRRLGTDYIDILYFHRPLPDGSAAEAVRAVADLVRQGKLRYFGLSNTQGWRIAEVCRLADAIGIDRPVASQPLYNIVSRQAEVEQLPAAGFYGLGVVSYSPLARGVLTGKYGGAEDQPSDSRASRNDKRLMETEWRPESIAIAQKIKERAEAAGHTAGDFALAWVLANPLVSAAIVGPRTIEHWESYMRALQVTMDTEDERFVDSLVRPGHASTHFYTDPAYPIEGRPSLI